MDREQREIDLDIVSSSWRALTQTDGYDQLIDAWHRKIEALDRTNAEQASDEPAGGLIDPVLLRQMADIDRLLDTETALKVEDPIEAAVQAVPAPAVVISPEGHVVAQNRQAIDFFGLQQGAEAGRWWVREDSRREYETVRACARGQGNSSYAIIRIVGRDDTAHLAECYALTVEDHGNAYTVIRSLELEWHREVSDNLARSFGLTDAETEICRLLFQYRDLGLVAQRRGAQRETVRTQVKRIFAKLEVSSRAELLRLLALVCARAATGRANRSLRYVDQLGNEAIVRRRDGRDLAWCWTGAESGRPVLLVHCDIPYFALPRSTREMLEARNVKLVCISMPGHGNSGLDPAVGQLEDGSAAIIELCEALGLRNIPALSANSGQYPLLHAAVHRPDLFERLMTIGLPRNLNPQRWKRMPLIKRTVASLARRSPAVFETFCRIGYRRFIEEGPDFYLRLAFGETPIDRDTIRDPEFQSLVRIGCRHLANQGHMAFSREQSMAALCDINALLSQLQVPLHWLSPEQVRSIREDDLDDALAAAPFATLEVVPDCGELLPYQRPDTFVARLTDMVAGDSADRFAGDDGLRPTGTG